MIGWLSIGVAALVTAPADFTAKTFVSNGHTLTYEVAGTGAPVVVLAGGPGLSPDYVMPIAEAVSKKAKAILFHQWGTGKSPMNKSLVVSDKTINIDTAIADLEALRKRLGVSKITLAGHSWGGMLAQAYAAKHPTHTAKLILISSGGPDTSFESYFEDNLNMRQTEADIAEGKEADQIQDPQKRAEAKLLALLPAYFYLHEQGLKEKAAMAGALKWNSGIMGPLLQHYDVKKTVGKYKGPVALIQGRQDPIGESTAYQIKGVLPQTKITWIEKSGHFPWLEQPTEFTKTLDAALK